MVLTMEIMNQALLAKGLIVREHCKYPSNFESRESLDSYLEKQGCWNIRMKEKR